MVGYQMLVMGAAGGIVVDELVVVLLLRATQDLEPRANVNCIPHILTGADAHREP
jgi:hypothetical protein